MNLNYFKVTRHEKIFNVRKITQLLRNFFLKKTCVKNNSK